MSSTRVSYPVNHDTGHECDLMQIDDYEMMQVRVPSSDDALRTGIRVVIRGRNFTAMGQPLMVYVGDIPLRYLRIAPDERSVEGILLQEPENGTVVEIRLGDQDAVRHPEPIQRNRIKRFGSSPRD